MPELSQYLSFALLMAVGQYTPGPDMLLIVKNALNHGRSAGFWTVAGICLGVTVHTVAALTGVQILFQTWPAIYVGLRLAGAGYLGYLGVRLLLSLREADDIAGAEGRADGAEARDSISPGKTFFVQGLVTNLLNVKVLVLFSSLIAAFTNKDTSSLSAWIYGAIIVGQGILLWIVFVLVLDGKRTRQLFTRWEKGLNLTFGVLLLLVALSVVISLMIP